MVHLDELNQTTAGYVAGYVVKKMTKKEDSRLLGRVPEFARMSNRPGIGHGYMRRVAARLLSNSQIRRQIMAAGDAPSTLSHGGKVFPIGPYLKEVLRSALIKAGIPLSVSSESYSALVRKEEMRLVRKAAQVDSKIHVSLEQAVEQKYRGARHSAEARAKIKRTSERL